MSGSGLSERCRRCILAKAHARAGDAQVAASRILEVVATPFERDDLSLWLILADLYIDRLDNAKTGEKLLWQLFTEFPDVDSIFERLNCLYNTNPERGIFVENIKTYVASSEAIKKDPALKRKYLSFAAKILSNELRMWNEANDLYAAALEASEEPAEPTQEITPTTESTESTQTTPTPDTTSLDIDGVTMTIEKPKDTQLDLF